MFQSCIWWFVKRSVRYQCKCSYLW